MPSVWHCFMEWGSSLFSIFMSGRESVFFHSTHLLVLCSGLNREIRPNFHSNICVGVNRPSGLVNHVNWQTSPPPALSPSWFGIEAYSQGSDDPETLHKGIKSVAVSLLLRSSSSFCLIHSIPFIELLAQKHKLFPLNSVIIDWVWGFGPVWLSSVEHTRN